MTTDDFSKDNVLVVQVTTGAKGDEELTAIGIRSSICHGQQTTLCMLHSKGFVRELFAINRFPARTVVLGKVPTLTHESFDHAMEGGLLVTKTLSSFSRGKTFEVQSSFGNNIIEQSKGQPSNGFPSNRNFKENV